MGIIFNIDEIFRIAEQVEKNGREFYLKAAENTDNAGAKKLFKELADWEVEHEELFKQLRKDFAAQNKSEETYDPDNEGVLYLNAFARGHVFPLDRKGAELLSGSETPEEIMKLAIGFEKDAIVFYLGMEGLVPENLGRDKVSRLVKEEMTHIRILSEKIKELS